MNPNCRYDSLSLFGGAHRPTGPWACGPVMFSLGIIVLLEMIIPLDPEPHVVGGPHIEVGHLDEVHNYQLSICVTEN